MGEKGGRPKRTTCRICFEPGELFRGAHRACYNEHQRKVEAEKRGDRKCERCGVILASIRAELCDGCRAVRRSEAQKRYEAHRPKTEAWKRNQARRKTKAAPKSPSRPHPMGQIVISQPKPKPMTGPPTNPHNIQPRRIDPVGAAGMSFEEYRRS